MFNVHRMEHPATIQWGLPLTYKDYNKLLKGFIPRDMDDKWLCLVEEPDAQAGKPNETGGNDWAKITSISWRTRTGNVEVTEEDAKERAVRLCRWELDCDMKDALPSDE
ncbi:hypothetical protein N0V90_009124 [Kalmusia sp. IMI 367209]|nr:hypothetical protein N0V90_009124 [Kalmusia sp. IMI 367209]